MKKTLKISAVTLAGLLLAVSPQNGFSKSTVNANFQKSAGKFLSVNPFSLEARGIYTTVQKQLTDTVRTVGLVSGPNPKVTIDGKSYSADILTRISPNCIASEMDSSDEVTITTKEHKIEYATPTDIENAKIIIHWENSTYPCFRYYLAHEDGSHYAVVRVNMYGWGLEAKVPAYSKVLIIIDGKKYSEEEAQVLHLAETDPKPTFKIADTAEDMTRLYPQFAKEYGGVIEFTNVKN